MSETIAQDGWVTEYLGLAVPPPPGPQKDLGEHRADVVKLAQLAEQVAEQKTKLAKLRKQVHAESGAVYLLTDMLCDEFDAAIDDLEQNEEAPTESKPAMLKQLEADRTVFTELGAPEGPYKPGVPNRTGLDRTVTKLMATLASSRAELEKTLAEDSRIQKSLDPVYREIGQFASHEVDGVARTARALLDGRNDPSSHASTAALADMLNTGKQSRVVVWIDHAEKDNAEQAQNAQGMTAMQADRQNRPEREKEQDRAAYEENLTHMTAGELQAFIEGNSDVLQQFELDYADDEGKAKVRQWMNGAVRKAQQLLPNAPPDPAPLTEQELEQAVSESRTGEREMRRNHRESVARSADDFEPGQIVPESHALMLFPEIVAEINAHGDRYEIVSAQREARRADLAEGAKRVAGDLRLVIASGLPGVPPRELPRAMTALGTIEATFAAIAGGDFGKAGDDVSIVRRVSEEYRLGIDDVLQREAEATLNGVTQADPASTRYQPPTEWQDLVDKDGHLAPRLLKHLVEKLKSCRTGNPQYEKVRGQIENVLQGTMDTMRFPPGVLKALD